MRLAGVMIETSLPVEELQRESDRVGNSFEHTQLSEGLVHIKLAEPTNERFLMNIWLEAIENREAEILRQEEGDIDDE